MEYIFILSSVTYALKGKKLLEKNGITTSLVKAENIKELRGCGYGLKIKKENKKFSEEILISAGIRIISITEDEK